MSLFAKNPDQIIQECLDFLKANTSISSTGPGSKFQALIQMVKNQLSEAYTTFDYNVAIGFVYGASGIYLDYLGDIFKLQRLNSSSSQVSSQSNIVKFYTLYSSFGKINNDQDIIIPAGTSIWAMRSGVKVPFYVVEDTVLSKYANEGSISVQAEGTGTTYNVTAGSIKYFDFTNYADYKNSSLLLTNTSSIDNGLDSESDDNYRYRIINQSLNMAAANNTAIRFAALNVAGVADVTIIPYFYGIGSTLVLVKSTSPTVSQELLDNVQTEIDKVAADGVVVIAEKPNELKLSFVITTKYKRSLTADEKSNIQLTITQTIADYLNNKDIGEGFNVNELANLVISSDPLILAIGTSGRFFDKIYLNTPVLNTYVQKELSGDYTPGSMEKLILSDTNPIIFKDI